MNEKEREQALADFLARQDRRDKRSTLFQWLVVKPAQVAAIIFAVFLLVYLISCIPHTVRFEMDGVQYRRSAPEEYEPVRINVDGKITDRLFRDPEFEGLMEISTVDGTKATQAVGYLRNWPPIEGVQSALVAYYPLGSHLDTLLLLYTDRKMSFLAYNLHEPTSETSSITRDLVIVAPATTVDEGERIISERNLPIRDNSEDPTP